VVTVNGKEEKHPEGAYYLEWRDSAKRVRLSVGKDAADASARRQRKEAELNAVNNGVSIVAGNGNRSLAAAVTEYLEETKLSKKSKTLSADFHDQRHLPQHHLLIPRCHIGSLMWPPFSLSVVY
jgi:hypothetical protein